MNVEKPHLTVNMIHWPALLKDPPVTLVLGSPFHIVDSVLPGMHCPVFFLSRHLKAFPNEVAR